MVSPASPSGPDRPRRTAGVLVAIVAIVVVAAGLVILSGGANTAPPSIATPPTAAEVTPAYPDLSLVPVPATSTPVSRASPGSTASPGGQVSAAPSTAGPSAVAGREVRAKRIRIDRLGIDLRIVEGDGIDAPIGKAAHYPGSAWPGGGSNIYIYGHAREGMFLSLWKAKVGDIVELDLVDGTTRSYVIDQVLPKVPWNALKYARPTAAEQLTLQTSTSYHPTSPRFIVIAVPAP